MTARAPIGSPDLFPPPKLKRLPRFLITELRSADGMTWRRVHEPDGSVTYEGHCPSPLRVLPLRVFHQVRGLTKPYAVRCACGGWHKLP